PVGRPRLWRARNNDSVGILVVRVEIDRSQEKIPGQVNRDHWVSSRWHGSTENRDFRELSVFQRCLSVGGDGPSRKIAAGKDQSTVSVVAADHPRGAERVECHGRLVLGHDGSVPIEGLRPKAHDRVRDWLWRGYD